MKLALIPNTQARAFREDRKLMEALWRLVQGRGITTEPTTVAEIPEAIENARDYGVDTIVVAGGDGTLGHVTSAVVNTWGDAPLPQILVLHAGTMNTISRSMGNRGTPVQQLDALVSGAPMQRTRRWPLQVGEHRYGWLFGVGLIAAYIEEYERGPEPPSPKKAARTLGQAVVSSFTGGELYERLFARVTAEVTVEDRTWPIRDWLFLTAGAVDDIGLGFRPFAPVLQHPGKFHALGLGSTAARFALDLPSIYLGRNPRHSLLFDAPAEVLRLRFDGTLRYNLDGELETARSPLVVRAGPPLTFLLPPGSKPPRNTLGPG